MPPTPISLCKAAVPGGATSTTVGGIRKDVRVGRESLEAVAIDLTTTTDIRDIKENTGMGNGEKEYLAFML
jgi:hypothetical protein